MMGTVYTTPEGNVEISFRNVGFHVADRSPVQDTGWRERPDGSREQVFFRGGRWVSDTEVNTACVEARTFRR